MAATTRSGKLTKVVHKLRRLGIYAKLDGSRVSVHRAENWFDEHSSFEILPIGYCYLSDDDINYGTFSNWNDDEIQSIGVLIHELLDEVGLSHEWNGDYTAPIHLLD